MAGMFLVDDEAGPPLVTWRDTRGRGWAAPADLLGTCAPEPRTEDPGLRTESETVPVRTPLSLMRRRKRPGVARLLGTSLGWCVLLAALGLGAVGVARVFLPGLLPPVRTEDPGLRTEVRAAQPPPALTATPIPPPVQVAAAPLPPTQSSVLSPGSSSSPPGLVRVGDTPASLAARLGVSESQLPQTFYAGELVSPSQAAPAARTEDPGLRTEAAAPDVPAAADDPLLSPQSSVLSTEAPAPPCLVCNPTVLYTGPQPAPEVAPYTGVTRPPFVPGYAPATPVPFIGPLKPGQCVGGRCGP